MKLYDILDRDPRTARLVNNGQARIDSVDEELRAELEDFVSDGQFGQAVERVIERFLGNLSASRQESVWISGFYGSGKSHLLKMLTHFWVNTTFKDGSTARNLIRGGLPDAINEQLRELDTEVKRSGKVPVAVAGTMLGGNDRVRETILSIILKSCGWPTQYPQAQFCFWLREQGILEKVQSSVESAGRDWLKELNNLYVSPFIAKALIEADSGFATDEQAAHQILINQYPQSISDITTAQFTDAVKKALSQDEQLPLTLIVLDEVQQYINVDNERSAIFTEVAEALQTQFESKVMLVGAGQSALSAGTHALMWLRDRFRITFELADSDVNAVTRKVLLQKKTSAKPDIEIIFETHAGEIARHLEGTKISVKPEDIRTRIEDYPLLPTRRRFWEACFQAADRAGSQSQLRSQLRILHDSLHEISEANLGKVIPASDLFDALSAELVNTGVLLNELNTRIQSLNDGTPEGRLRKEICGLVFLIGKLPREAGIDLGIRSNAITLADLMISDITKDSGPFRNHVAETLNELATESTLMKIEDEYRLQTTEGAEWNRKFRERQTILLQNEPHISTLRDNLFASRIQEVVSGVKLNQGAAKIRRNISLHTGDEPPHSEQESIVVWLRDAWSCSEKDVLADARRMGQGDPVLHVYLPHNDPDGLKARIIEAEAAKQVLDHYGSTTTPEGNEAHESMNSRLLGAENLRDEIILTIVRSSKIFQGGGNEIYEDELAEKIQKGADASLARLFPRFDEADHNSWHVALKRAKEGNDQPFVIIGWDDATENHPVSKEVLNVVGVGARGNEVQKNLKVKPFGWSQDAIDAVLIALHCNGHLRATKNVQHLAPGHLDQAGVKLAEFRPESVRLTTTQRIELRGLFEKIGVTTKSGEEETRSAEFLETVKQLAIQSGGESPLPPPADISHIENLSRLAGAEQLAAIHADKTVLEKNIEDWSRLEKRRKTREPLWQMAASFAKHAEGLKVLDEVAPELEAIKEQRALLENVDPVAPLLGKLGTALRDKLNEMTAQLKLETQGVVAQLAADSTWQQLDSEDQEKIIVGVKLIAPDTPSTADDEKLKAALDATNLNSWQHQIQAVPTLVQQALSQAAQKLKEKKNIVTTTITVARGTLDSEEAVQQWLSEHAQKLKEAITKGSIIIQ